MRCYNIPEAFLMRLPAPPLLALALLIAACGSGAGDAGPEATAPPRNPEETAERFLSLWQEGRYADMYDLLSEDSRNEITRDRFILRYEAITEEARIESLDYELGDISHAETITAPFTVTFHTTFFGDIEQENALTLLREEIVHGPEGEGESPTVSEEWRVDWHPSVFFAELDDRTLVHFFTRVPRRGAIYDRHGRELAVDAQLPVIGIVPDLITDREQVISRLSQALEMPAHEVRAQVEADLPSYYFIPIRTLPYGTAPEDILPFHEMVDLGVVVREETQRLYPHGEAAAHVLGYMREVTAEELEELRDHGFGPGDMIGAYGLEGQMDDVLAGERGALLATITPEGTISRTIAEKPAVPGRDIHLALDIEVQKRAEAELGDRVGSLVAIDPRDNSVLALASYPRFDPNAFIRGLTGEEFNTLVNDPRQRFLFRPLLATYPAGSTFKVVTMAAGLEHTEFSAGSAIHCPPVWTGLGEDFAQRNWQTTDRGFLTPAEGLMASCNPVFFELAKRLDEIDEDILPEVSRQFGFGAPTGIGMDEAPGVLPDPEWKQRSVGEPWYRGDAVNMAIGQGFVLVTPLQITNMYSAIAHSGVLRSPLLIKRIVEPVSGAAQEFEAEEINPLPVSHGTLEAIRHGLTLVTQNPGGTSYNQWVGAGVDAAGKSGTAEDIAVGSDHVFFVAYANRADPQIVALAALEDGESGSREAAPMVRRLLEAYIGGALVGAP
jgi:penicillin-binding protein 2